MRIISLYFLLGISKAAVISTTPQATSTTKSSSTTSQGIGPDLVCPQRDSVPTGDYLGMEVKINGERYSSNYTTLRMSGSYPEFKSDGDLISKGLCSNVTIIGDLRSSQENTIYSDLPLTNDTLKYGKSSGTMSSTLSEEPGLTSMDLSGNRIVFYEGGFFNMALSFLETASEVLLPDGKLAAQYQKMIMASILKYKKMRRVEWKREGSNRLASCKGSVLFISNGRAEIQDLKKTLTPDNRAATLFRVVSMEGDVLMKADQNNKQRTSKFAQCWEEERTEHIAITVVTSRGMGDTETVSFPTAVTPIRSWDGTCLDSDFILKREANCTTLPAIPASTTVTLERGCTVASEVSREAKNACEQIDLCGVLETPSAKNAVGCYPSAVKGGEEKTIASLADLGRPCTCTKSIPYKDPGVSIVDDHLPLSDVFCSQVYPMEVAEHKISVPPIAPVDESQAARRRRKRAGFCFIICFGFGNIAETEQTISGLKETVATINRNFIALSNTVNNIVDTVNKVLSEIEILKANDIRLQNRVMSIEEHVNIFERRQNMFNRDILRYMMAIETQVAINNANIDTILSFLNSGGKVLEKLYKSAYERRSDGCYSRVGSFLYPTVPPEMQELEGSKYAIEEGKTIERLKQLENIEVVPDVNVSVVGISRGLMGVIIALVLLGLAFFSYILCTNTHISNVIKAGSSYGSSASMQPVI